MTQEEAGPSGTSEVKSPTHANGKAEMTPRQKEKSRAVRLEDIVLDDARLDRDLSLLISQYLHTKQNTLLARTFDEEVLGLGKGKQRQEDTEEVERALFDGEFGLLEGLIGRPGLLKPQSQKAFLYLCYRQQFLEHVENRESQKAFNLLQKRLKPLEHYQPVPYDFYNLCYLTSAGTVHDAPGLKDWGGVGPEREKLVSMWREITDATPLGDTAGSEREKVAPGRLLLLMKQAAAWQVQHSKGKRQQPYNIRSLLQDYASHSIPNTLRLKVRGHTANVKCVDFIEDEPVYAVSGSSDSTLRIFSVLDGTTRNVLSGHRSRIWDCAVSTSGRYIASASGDGTVRIWSVDNGECENVLAGDSGDVYGVRWRPNREDQVVSASYDRILRSWDVESGAQLRTFSGHSQSTLAAAYDHTGNVLASGSKDKNVRLWDAIGGMCVKTLSGSLGEITSVEFDSGGKYLLVGCKDNWNRLWDLRMQRVIYRYTGHQNTSKNLIRCAFAGHDSSLIISGSEDGNVYIWNREPTAAPSDSIKATGHALSSPRPLGSTNLDRAGSLRGREGDKAGLAQSSPAYYPPRDDKLNAPMHGNSGSNVKPVQILEGHGHGAVFDVRWKAGEILSAGEDGIVGVWHTAEEE